MWVVSVGLLAATGGSGNDTISIRSLSGITQPIEINFGSTFIPVVAGVNGATYSDFENLIF
jgi:hypothetical protein